MNQESLIYLRYSIPIILAIGFFLVLLSFCFYNKKVQETFLKHSEKIKTDFITHKRNRYVQDFIPGKLSVWLDDTYKYSRFYMTSIGQKINTSIKFFVTSIGISILVGIIMGSVLHELLWGLISCIFTELVIYIGLYVYRSYQNMQVTKDVATFLNLLGNYSTVNTEITSVFMQIAPKMHEPLSSALVECVAESENQNQTQIQALQNLSAKIENRKIREIISSLIITKKYSGSFSDTVNAFRGSVLAFVRRSNEARSLSIQNGISLSVVLGILLVSLFIMGSFVETSIPVLLFHTKVGIVVVSIAAACILYFVKKIIEVMQ